MAGLDSFLNFVIPIGVIIFFGFIMFKALGPELSRFGRWISGLFESKEDNTPEVGPQIGGTIVYTK